MKAAVFSSADVKDSVTRRGDFSRDELVKAIVATLFVIVVSFQEKNLDLSFFVEFGLV